MSAAFRVAHMIDVPGAAGILEEWFVQEWAPWYGPDGPGDARADLGACRQRDRLPICLVALDGNGTLLGTAALRASSAGSELGFSPWLAGMLVQRAHRRQGVGTALVAAIEQTAALLGTQALYCSTDTAGGILERRGWVQCGSTGTLRGPARVYRCQIMVVADG